MTPATIEWNDERNEIYGNIREGIVEEASNASKTDHIKESRVCVFPVIKV